MGPFAQNSDRPKFGQENPAESGPVENLEDLVGKNGLVASMFWGFQFLKFLYCFSVKVRVKICRKPVINDIQRKLDGTIVYDGHFKAQLVFTNEIAFEAKEEISVLSSNVVWAGENFIYLFSFIYFLFLKIPVY